MKVKTNLKFRLNKSIAHICAQITSSVRTNLLSIRYRLKLTAVTEVQDLMSKTKMSDVLKFLFVETVNKSSVVQLDEVLDLIPGEKKTRGSIHESLISTFSLTFMQNPGHKDGSPRGKYAGLRKRTAEERLGRVKLVISVGTAFEAKQLEELFGSRDSFRGDLIDVQRIVTRLSDGGFPWPSWNQRPGGHSPSTPP